MNFFNSPARDEVSIQKDVDKYLKTEMEKNNFENCYTYERDNPFFKLNKRGPPKYIPKSDFNKLNKEIEEIQKKEIQKNIYSFIRNTKLFALVEDPNSEDKDTVYYRFDNQSMGYTKIGVFIETKTYESAGQYAEMTRGQSKKLNRFNIDPTNPNSPNQSYEFVYKYTPQNLETSTVESTKKEGGKPKKSRRQKNKKRRSSRRKN